ncbi:phosphodiester glycosidase family protein [Demequina aurantiaca]|uniref:phosphodiester glycosidase family protein n=1 Tax=Demequina aurantiaca TaxID=676200 RepID=UPI003D32E827
MEFSNALRFVMGATAGCAVLLASGCGADGGSPQATQDSAGATEPSSTASATSLPSSAAEPSQTSSAVDAQVIEHAGNRYLVATLPLADWDVRVDWFPEDNGTMLRDLVSADPSIAVATNAGIFTEQLVPGGLLVSDGTEMVPLNLNEGGGNFHLMPNAVFALFDDGSAGVVNSVDYDPAGVEFATQSGPALLLDSEVHPEFNEGSANLAFRSGVGVSPDGETVYLAMSWSLTNFFDFATLFSDELGVENALYLDGDISDLWVDTMDEPGPFAGPYAGVITARQRG